MAKQIKPEVETFARIVVAGVGGSGNNAVNHMIKSKIKGVKFIAINTDAQALHHSDVQKKDRVHIGKNLTKGLGTGMNPNLGQRAAEETREELQEKLKGADMVFIAGGMGGGTGTGSAPIVAKIAKELGALTVAVVTKPFFFEGAQRSNVAEQGIANLKKEVDAIIVIPNDKLFENVEKDTTATDAFALSDEILRVAVEGISDLITLPGFINVDFADVRAIMENAGSALMGVGTAGGENRAAMAATMAINSPLLDSSIEGANGILFAISGGPDLTMNEIQEAAKVVTESIDPNAKVIFGGFHDDRLKKGEVRVTVIASGFPDDQIPTIRPKSFIEKTVAEVEESNTGENTKDGVNRIYNSLGLGKRRNNDNRDEKRESSPKNTQSKQENEQKNKPNENKKPEVQKQSKKKQPAPEKKPRDDEDDGWGDAIPSFLRRSKLR